MDVISGVRYFNVVFKYELKILDSSMQIGLARKYNYWYDALTSDMKTNFHAPWQMR